MTIEQHFECVKRDKALLRQFVSAMPKGGDLHNHLTGSAYAETYFEIACRDRYRVDMEDGKLYPPHHDAPNVIELSPSMPNLHQTRMALIDKWSIRNFQPYKCQLGPDEYFFGEFGLFKDITNSHDNLGRLAHELKVRAVEENLQYLEIMATSPHTPKNCLMPAEAFKGYSDVFDECCAYRLRDVDFYDTRMCSLINGILDYWDTCRKEEVGKAVKDYIALIEKIDDDSFVITTPFDTAIISPDSITTRYLGMALRHKNPVEVLWQLYIAHKAVCDPSNKLIVGCNIVSAENSEPSMFYFHAHMAMFKVLNGRYPSVKTSLHAGELTIGLIRPEYLTFHIRESVYVANANRIGHGVDIPFEHNNRELLKYMKKKRIPVEINLTSNEFILGVKDGDHPFGIYKSNDVPMVICTDDPGILSTSITEELAIAIERYNLDYNYVKTLVRNSIEYSFLDDATKDNVMDNLNESLTAFENSYQLQRGDIRPA